MAADANLVRDAVLGCIAAGLIAVSAILWQHQGDIDHNQRSVQAAQQASTCWNRVLVVALHDNLTPPKRAALIRQADRCASLTK